MAEPRRFGDPLSDREVEVLDLVIEGLSNGEIGKKLFLAEDTVKTHVHRVLCKLGARTRAHAVAIAFQRGLVSPSGAQSGDGRGYYRHRAGPTEKHTGVSIRALLGGFDYYAGIGPAVRFGMTTAEAWALHACLSAALNATSQCPQWLGQPVVS